MEKHPLQRYHSPSRSLSAIFHAAGLYSFSHTFIFLYDNPTELSLGFGWQFKFLTIIGLALATFTFAIGLLADLTISDRVFKWKNVSAIVSAPLAVVIAILYWGISLIDPHAVIPAHITPPPLIEDIGLHLSPGVLLMVDLLLLSPPWTITVIEAGGIGAILACAYWFWTEECYRRNGWYPYPLFDALDHPQRVLVFAASAVTFSITALCLKGLYDLVNGALKVEHRKKV